MAWRLLYRLYFDLYVPMTCTCVTIPGLYLPKMRQEISSSTLRRSRMSGLDALFVFDEAISKSAYVRYIRLFIKAAVRSLT